MTRRLSAEAVIHINELLMGWNHQLDDRGALESAVNQPFATWDGRDLYPTLVGKAAILLRGIAANHPFFEGNKRTAWIACAEFLSFNGSPIDDERTDRVEAGRMVESLVKHEIDVDHLTLWIIDHLR